MRITLFWKVILLSLIAILAAFFLPLLTMQNAGDLLLPVTFLFGAIYSFEILKVITNFSDLKKHLALETSNLVYMYHAATVIGGEFATAVQLQIEKYTLTSIDYSLKYHISSTDQDFMSLIDPVETYQPKTEKEKSALEGVTHGFHKILEARYQLAQVAPREISMGEWVMMVLLAIILIMALFLGRQPSFMSQSITGIFSAIVLGTLFLLDEADSNQLQETRLEYEVFNQVLTDIGKTEYYPEFAIKKHLVVPPKNARYRIGVFPHYPKLSDREIKEMNKS